MCNYLNQASLVKCVTDAQPDVIVNAAGLTQQSADICDVIAINGLFPHLLLKAVAVTGTGAGTPIIHMSSTEVFSGRTQDCYTVTDIPDPKDYQGRSKSLGEIFGANVCVVRANILAPEHGFMKFLFDSRGKKIEAWDNALMTPGTVDDVSEVILWIADRMLEGRGAYSGIIHLATQEKISKYGLALLVNELFNLGLTIKPVFSPRINRSLQATVVLRSIREGLSFYVGNNAADEEKTQLRAASNQIA